MNTPASPAALTTPVLAFCASLSPGQTPVWLQPATLTPAESAEVRGWLIREQPGLYLEAIPHVARHTPEGHWSDPEPPVTGGPRLFLPGDGQKIALVRRALVDSPVINDLLRLYQAEARFGLAPLQGAREQLFYAAKEARTLLESLASSGLNRARTCPCGSGERYRHCHEPLIAELLRMLEAGEADPAT